MSMEWTALLNGCSRHDNQGNGTTRAASWGRCPDMGELDRRVWGTVISLNMWGRVLHNTEDDVEKCHQLMIFWQRGSKTIEDEMILESTLYLCFSPFTVIRNQPRPDTYMLASARSYRTEQTEEYIQTWPCSQSLAIASHRRLLHIMWLSPWIWPTRPLIWRGNTSQYCHFTVKWAGNIKKKGSCWRSWSTAC